MIETLRTFIEVAWESDRAHQFVRASLLLVIGLGLGRLVTRTVGALSGRVLGVPRGRVMQNIAWYAVVFVVITSVLRELDFDLSVLLGAAGVLTVAIGFASQTSASNVISGIFLLVERPFEPGDVVQVEGITGEVLNVDLLSVRLRTPDNLFVRVPNEFLIKARITNHSRFPLRRVDIPLGVHVDSDLERVRAVLEGVARSEPLVLEEPSPAVVVVALGDRAVQLSFNIWVMSADVAAARANVIQTVLQTFRKEGIALG